MVLAIYGRQGRRLYEGRRVGPPPDRILRMLEERRRVGEFELATSFRFGGIPFEVAEKSMRLFAKEILPAPHSWQTARAPAAVERTAAE